MPTLDELDDRPWRDPEVLREFYQKRQLSLADVAEELGCAEETVRKNLEKHGVERRSTNGQPKDAPWTDGSTLREMYHGEEMTIAEVADEFGVSTSTIKHWMEKHDIKKRSHSEIMRRRYSSTPAPFYTDKKGYEYWQLYYKRGGAKEKHWVSVSRLSAVAWFGFEALDGKEVHHKNTIPFDNREGNIGLLTPSEHSTHHASERVHDDTGEFIGVSRNES